MRPLLKRVMRKAARMRNDFMFDRGMPQWWINGNVQSAILMYHGVSPDPRNPFNSRHTGVEDFNRQLSFLSRYTEVISLSEYFARKPGPQDRVMALTFDDGYENNYSLAKPLLERYKLPATFFVTGLNRTQSQVLWADLVNILTALYRKPLKVEGVEIDFLHGLYWVKDAGMDLMTYIKLHRADFPFKEALTNVALSACDFRTEARWKPYWSLMTDDQISETHLGGLIEIGSHGFYHNNLGTLPLADAEAELHASVHYLKTLTGKPPRSIGYPDGSYSRAVVEVASALGMPHQVAANGFHYPEDADDPRLRDRKGIYASDSAANQILSALKP